MIDLLEKAFEEEIKSYIGEKNQNNLDETEDGYSISKLHETKDLVIRYYSNKLCPEATKYVQTKINSVYQDKDYKIFEAFYILGWHPERISQKYRCSESKMKKLSEEVLKKLSVSFWGADALTVF